MAEAFPHDWPNDLPATCPNCGKEFRTSRNLFLGPGRLGRFFRRLAYWGMVPWAVLSWVILGAGVVEAFDWTGPGGLALVGYFLLPVILFFPIALFMPDSRRVRCFECGFARDFKLLPDKVRREAGDR